MKREDEDQLRLLSIFHYVVAGFAALFSCLPIFHIVIGLMLVFAPGKLDGGNSAPPAIFGWLFACVGAALVLAGWSFAVLVFLAGRFLAKQTRYTFCLAMAGVQCMFVPFGTVLGIFTIIVLMRESVKADFSIKSAVPLGGSGMQ